LSLTTDRQDCGPSGSLLKDWFRWRRVWVAQRFQRCDQAVLSMRALQVAEKLKKVRRNVEDRRCGRAALQRRVKAFSINAGFSPGWSILRPQRVFPQSVKSCRHKRHRMGL